MQASGARREGISVTMLLRSAKGPTSYVKGDQGLYINTSEGSDWGVN